MKGFIKKTFFVVFSILYIVNVQAQSRSQLEKERNRIIKQIEENSKNLEKTKSNKKATLKDLRTIENQIKNRKALIKNIQNQLKKADQSIADNKNKIIDLNSDIALVDMQYIQLARKMYMRDLAGNKWAYIFSSNSVNEAFLKWRYSKQFENYVKQKTINSNQLKGSITNQNEVINIEKATTSQLLASEKKNAKKLQLDQNKKDEILKKLKKEEKQLLKNIKKNKRQREQLNDEIEKVILAELSKKRTGNVSFSSKIEKNKLAWPSSGYVSSSFGKQAHPTIKNVTINNNGVDITCKSSATVSAVADGEVISITNIPGYDNMVIIQHGKYYSVYSKIKIIIIQKGERVSSGQTIGRLSNIDNPILHFEFWKEKQKLNPASWLKVK
ncbi:MAG: peptidoglycan DD-metalloendopeptidase family protein [Saprospiraceae bacterium]